MSQTYVWVEPTAHCRSAEKNLPTMKSSPRQGLEPTQWRAEGFQVSDSNRSATGTPEKESKYRKPANWLCFLRITSAIIIIHVFIAKKETRTWFTCEDLHLVCMIVEIKNSLKNHFNKKCMFIFCIDNVTKNERKMVLKVVMLLY